MDPPIQYGDAIRFNRALEKARAIASDDHIQHAHGNVYNVRSDSYPDKSYTATTATCSCFSWQSHPHTYAGTRTCKHTLAIRLLQGEQIMPMPETVNQETPAVTTAPSPTLCTLQAIAASMEALNGRVSNIEDKFDKLLDLVATALVHVTLLESLPSPTGGSLGLVSMPRAPLASNRVIVQATSIAKGFDSRSSKPTLSVMCGEWQKFGVPLYPETAPRLGFDDIDNMPMGTFTWDKDIIVELRDDGRPKKVIGLAN